MLQALRTNYVESARARGLPDRVVDFGRALRNALVPVLTISGLQLGSLIAFSVVTETMFAWPGMGSLFIQAVPFPDVPVMAAALCLIALMFVLINPRKRARAVPRSGPSSRWCGARALPAAGGHARRARHAPRARVGRRRGLGSTRTAAGLRIPSTLPAREQALPRRAAGTAGFGRGARGVPRGRGRASPRLLGRRGQGRRAGAFERCRRRGRARAVGRARQSRDGRGSGAGPGRQVQRPLLAARRQRQHERRGAHGQDSTARRAAVLR